MKGGCGAPARPSPKIKVSQGASGGYWELIAYVRVAGRGVWEEVVWESREESRGESRGVRARAARARVNKGFARRPQEFQQVRAGVRAGE